MTTLYWVGGTDTSFSSGANWSTTSGGSAAGVAPGANDTLIFDSNSTKNCDLDATNPTITILKVESGFSYQLISSSTQVITVRQYIEVNQAGCFGFTSGNIITFSFNKAGAAISAYDGAGSAYTAGDIYVKYGANASVFADSTARSNCIYDFSADQNVVLVDGVYPNIISEGILYAKYITADSSATAFNTYGSVDILQYRTNGNGTVRSTSHDIYDYDKEFFFESIHSSGIGEYFQFGHTTARFKSGSATFRLPVLGDVYTNFGNNTTNTFNVQYHKIVIEAGDDSTYYCYIQPGKTLDCNELVIRDGGRLYGPAEGNQVASAKIKSVKRPTVQGDWNFKQIADGIYESIDNIPTLPVTEGGTGLNTVPVGRIPYGDGQKALATEADFTYDATDNVLEVDKILSHIVIKVQNDTGSTIPKGQAVYVDAEGTHPSVAPALATDSTKMPSIGLAQEALATTGSGYVCVNGIITVSSSIIDDTLSDPTDVGKTLYVSETTAGNLTTTKPTSPNDLVQNVGKIADITGSNVKIIVSNIGRSNDVPNTIDIEGNITSDGNISAKDGTITGNTFVAGYSTGDAIFRTYNPGDHLELQTYDAGTSAFVTELEILNDQGGIQITNDVTSSGDLTLDRGSATSSLTRTLTIGGARNSTGSAFAVIDFKNYDSDDAASDYSAAKIRVFNSPSADDDGTIAFYTANNGTLATSPALSITDTGYVRVGPSGDFDAPLTVSQDTTTSGPSGNAQLVVKGSGTSGQDASIEVRGARNSSTTAVPTSIKFTNYDSDLSGSNILGAVIGKVTNHTTNVGSLILQTSADGSTLSDRLTITSAGNVTIANDLTVQGDFTVSGTTTTVDTTNLNITDNIITLNDGETGAGVTLGTAGIDIDRGTSTNATFLYDESIDGWVADSQGTGRTLKLQNTNGYIEFGPQNTSYAHITTDRSRFYFNRDLVIGENAISSYNGDFSIRRSQSTDEQIVIGDDSMTFTSAGNDVVTIDGTNARFGIGEATPDNKLHVNSGGSNGVAKFESTDNMASIAIADNDTTVYVVSETNYGSFGGTNDLAATNLNIHTTTGDVGIGTTSPSFTSGGGLEIENATQANLRVTDSTASTSSDFAQSNNDLYIVNRTTNGDIKIRVNSSNELMTFDGGNQTVLMGATSMGDNESKVGISGKLRVGDIANTQDGSARAYLHVDSGSEDPGGTSGDFVRLSTLMMDGGSGGNNVMYTTYALRNETGTTWTTLSIVDGVRVDTDSEVLKADGVTGSNIRMWHEIDAMAQKRHWGHANTLGMTYTGSGRLGIGTTSPDEALHIRSASDHPLVLENTTNAAYVGIQFSDNSSASYAQKGELRFNHADASSEGSGASFHFTTTESDLSIVGGKFISAVGSSSEPGFAFSGDYDNGMFRPATDEIAFTTAGSEAVRIDDSGNVGIGTTSPEGVLEIEQATTTGHALKVYRNQSSSNMDSSLVFLHDDSQYADEVTLHVKQDGTGYAGIFEGGNVGIGTTSPVSALDLNTGALSFANTNTQLKMTNSNTDLQLTHWGNAHIIVDSDGNDSNRYFSVRHGDTTASSATELFRIQEDGKVGIGETSPTFPLHIKYTDNRTDPEGSGSASGAGAIGADAEGSGLYIENLSTTDGSWSGVTFRTDTADARIAYQSVGSGLINEGQMSFFLDANDTGGSQLILEEVLRLRGGGSGAAQTFNSAYVNGRLGIGISSPDTQLHISSGNSGDCTVIIEADEDNNAEGDLPRLWFKADGGITEGAVQLSDNELDIIQNSASSGGIRFLTGSTSNTGTTDPATGASVRMLIQSDGDVGIGTTSPDSLLHIRGADPILTVEDTSIGISALSIDMAGIDLISDGMNAGASQYGTALKFLSTDNQLTTENPKFLAAIAPRATETYSADTDGGMALDFAVTDNDPGTTNVPVVRMTIDHTGNVGIGTTDPSGNLHVVGATGDSARIYLSDADNGTGTGDALLINKSGTNAFIYNRDSGDLRLGSNDNSDYVTIKSDGDVGIGTTSPESRLEVVAALNPSSATQFSYAEVLKLDVENSGTATGPAVRFRTGATNDHNAADYVFQVNGDGGGSSAHEYSFNWGYNKWYYASGADGTKPIINLSYGGSSSAGQTQYGVINLVSTSTAWDVYDGTHTGLHPTTYDNNVRINAGGDSYFNGGNVGIGVTSPVSTLDIGASGALSLGNIRTQLKITNSSADLQLGHADNAHILIDTFNNSTTNYFSVRKNSTTASSATELFRVQEDGAVKINDTYTLPTAAGNDDEILTYDTDTSAVSYSNLSRLTLPTVFVDGGNVDITLANTSYVIGFNTTATINVGSNASSTTTGHIALAKGGYYRVSFSIPINDDGTSGGDRTRVFAFMETAADDSFSSTTIVTQSRAQVYTRESSGGSGLSTSFIFQHTSEEYLRIVVRKEGTTDISTETGQSQISIEYLGS